MWSQTIVHAPSSMQPSVLYTSSPFDPRRYTWEGQTKRHGLVVHLVQMSVSTTMNGSSSCSNLSSPRRASTLSGLSASGFGGSGMWSLRRPKVTGDLKLRPRTVASRKAEAFLRVGDLAPGGKPLYEVVRSGAGWSGSTRSWWAQDPPAAPPR